MSDGDVLDWLLFYDFNATRAARQLGVDPKRAYQVKREHAHLLRDEFERIHEEVGGNAHEAARRYGLLRSDQGFVEAWRGLDLPILPRGGRRGAPGRDPVMYHGAAAQDRLVEERYEETGDVAAVVRALPFAITEYRVRKLVFEARLLREGRQELFSLRQPRNRPAAEPRPYPLVVDGYTYHLTRKAWRSYCRVYGVEVPDGDAECLAHITADLSIAARLSPPEATVLKGEELRFEIYPPNVILNIDFR